ncbi:TPA: hypothetical protein RKY24_003427 [Enterobacter hormaechei subsp. steigerwaltii]|uniref:hypothetical protein n=2 Tax=Enterobacter hormaechei TaxID=158836 RepID=UPI0009AF9631|nr:hypothetical protein [Enterobacter hormaechei]HDS8073521.1 hypothetical protein [Enterobacter hormaechei subsp. steigerwaltii]HDT4628487.1 hypothetical protein [Enterobacter hormaechei subsp. steigerwaltii]HDT4977718.1 hypothetical protein [Enterobacter hormaechei subsp. steigerwaltii]HDV9208038.1 hypothetical protein [Enterobacter hormaechei subsp. steigerwaltii]HDV9267780.1 hypothetical protein [Enterobacter hormaechei subsp. steigerwaltii]
MVVVDGVMTMNESRCIAQLLRNESPTPINFTITHGRGRKGIIIRTRKPGILTAVIKRIMKIREVSKWL